MEESEKRKRAVENGMLYIQIKSYDESKIEVLKKLFRTSAVVGHISTKKLTVIRSPHVDKRGREQIEMRAYSFTIPLKISEGSGIVLGKMSKVLERMPAGVSVRVRLGV